jgi:hypothetical protein
MEAQHSPPGEGVRFLQGIIQRVHYQRREMAVVAEGNIWQFVIGPECRLHFNDAEAILRCFHALDPIRIVYVEENLQALAIYSWETRPKQAG